MSGLDLEALRAAARRGQEQHGTPDLSGRGGPPTKRGRSEQKRENVEALVVPAQMDTQASEDSND